MNECPPVRTRNPSGNARSASASLPCCLAEYPVKTHCHFLLSNYSRGRCLKAGAMCLEVLGGLGYALLVWLSGVEYNSLAVELQENSCSNFL